jgi:hypothetical protein
MVRARRRVVPSAPTTGLRPEMRRVLDLYDHPPADGRVICVDEFGPLNLQPRKGKARGVAWPRMSEAPGSEVRLPAALRRLDVGRASARVKRRRGTHPADTPRWAAPRAATWRCARLSRLHRQRDRLAGLRARRRSSRVPGRHRQRDALYHQCQLPPLASDANAPFLAAAC